MIGVDVNAEKVAGVAAGRSPIVEAGLDVLLARAWRTAASTPPPTRARRSARADVSMITVGTPPLANGEPDLEYVVARVR